MKTERLLAIIVMLLSRPLVTAKEMAERFSVSKRTIYRDIVSLEIAGFPIVAIHGNEGGYQLMNTFKLHSYTFSEEEKVWLIRALELQNDLLADNQIGQKIIEKLRLLMMNDPGAFQMSLKQGTLHRQVIEAETKLKVAQFQDLMAQGLKVMISYVSANGQKTIRKISPRQLCLKNGSWYLIAYCELRKSEREFKLTRIRELQETTEKIVEVVNQIAAQPVVEKEKQQVICLFPCQALGKLYDFFTDKELEHLPTGEIQVKFKEESQRNLLPFLLMFGSAAKVLQPTSLKLAHIQAIKDMGKIYSS